jgi:putative ABC transport system permease protein
MTALVLGEGGGLWRPVAALAAVGVGSAALAGAALGGARPGPPADPLAAPGPAAALAAPPVVLLAAVLAYFAVRRRVAARCWADLAARGASGAQALLLAGGLPAILALALGLAGPLPLAVFWLALPLRPADSGPWMLLVGAWAAGAAAGAVLAGACLWGAVRGLGSCGRHVREAAVPEAAAWRRRWADAGLLALGGAAAAALAAGLPARAGTVAAAALRPLVFLAPAAWALGAALLAARAGAAAASWAARRWPEAEPGWTLALRAAARGGAPVATVVVACLTAFAAAFATSGLPVAARTAADLRAARVGSDVRLRLTWPLPCAPLCLLSPTAELRDYPLPPVAAPERGLPGVAAAAVLVPADDQLYLGSAGSLPVVTWGITPTEVAAAADWPPDGAAAGRRALAALAATPRGAVLSSALAARTGLGPGDPLQTSLLGVGRVLAVLPAWPGVPPDQGDWLVVRWQDVAPALQARGAWTTQGLVTYALLRLQPGADVDAALQALRAQRLQVQQDPPATDRGTPGALALVLLPLALAALLLGREALGREEPGDPATLPAAAVLQAVGAEAAAPRARALLHRMSAAWGGLWGLGAAWAAAPLFWPALRLADPTAGGLPVRLPPLEPAVLVAAGAALAAWSAASARRVPPLPGEPEVWRRLEAFWARRRRRQGPDAAEAPSAQGRPAGRAATLRRAVGLGPLALARLRVTWPRLLGLAAGLWLAAAVAATVPLYVAGALTRVLQQGLAPVNGRPAGAALVRLLPTSAWTPSDLDRLAELTAGLGPSLGLPATPPVAYLATRGGELEALPTPGLPPPTQTYLGSVTVDALSDLPAHVRLAEGRMYAEAPEADGSVEVVAEASAARAQGLEVGRRYRFLPSGGARPLEVRLVGTFTQLDPTGPYWPYRYYPSDLLAAPAVLGDLAVRRRTVALGEASWYTVLDLTRLDAEGVPAALRGLRRAAQAVAGVVPGAELAVSPYPALAAFVQRQETLQALLRTASLPVLALAWYFVAITAALVVRADAGEIAVYVSRGAGAGHVVVLYLLEWLLLAVPCAALAPLPAAAFARAMGAARGFLHFVPGPPLPVLVTRTAFLYAGVAVALGVAAALLPLLSALGQSIVAARRQASRPTALPLWQRAYLDLGALAAMAVLWLVFRSASLRPGAGAQAIAADPALYLLPAAFLAVAGLLVVRLLGAGLRALEPVLARAAGVAVLVPLRRIGRMPAQFAPVLLLLCFTAALGTYSAAAARTMDANLADSVRYRTGAPLRLEEVSPCVTLPVLVGACLEYDDVPPGPQGVRPLPPFDLHLRVPGVAAASDLVTQPVSVSGPAGVRPATAVLVDPQSFGRVAWWAPDLNPLPLDRYLGALRADPAAVFVDPQVLRGAGVAPGDRVRLTDQISGVSATFTVAGTVLRWPGVGQQPPFVVVGLGAAERALGVVEASRVALIAPAPGADTAAIVQGLAGYALEAARVDEAGPEVLQALGTPEWAGQSGMLSVGFAVALAVTAAGYLLYASLLLRGEMSQIGLLRALGLPWARVVVSVAVEQGTLLAAGAAAGVVAGLAAAAWLLPLFRPAFTGPDAPPFRTAGPGPALGQVAALLFALGLAALGVLLALLRRLQVGQTVKLED